MSKKNGKWQAFMERNRKSGGYLLRKKAFDIAYKICRAILIFGLCFLIGNWALLSFCCGRADHR